MVLSSLFIEYGLGRKWMFLCRCLVILAGLSLEVIRIGRFG